MRGFGFVVAVALAFSSPVLAQDAETLADIRQELSVLYVEVQNLKRELSTTGSASGVGGGSALQRVDNIEFQLQRLTAKTEELEFRIDLVVRDGTNRIGDLEFRLCELETGCDIGSLGETSTLGGVNPSSGPTTSPISPSAGAELAVGEQADFDTARAALDNGEFDFAANQFGLFLQNYPGGPLTGLAQFLQGEALTELGETAPAARAYLASFSGDPQAEIAPLALFKLGTSLRDLGQTSEACVTLGEVQARFPDADVAFDAGAERRALGCS
jgi:tol-pal system protein YbgF